MQFAELRDHLGAKRQRAGAAGVIPRSRARFDRRGHRRAHRGFERGQHVGLGVERVGSMRGFASSCACAVADADAGGDMVLRFRHAAFELRADLEQHQIVETARLVALRRRQQRRQHARPHRIQIGGDGIFELARIVAAAEQFGVGARNEAEIDRLVEAARSPACGARCGCGAATA